MLQPNATERFKSVKDAYEVLSDPQQRAAYNSQRLQVRLSYCYALVQGPCVLGRQHHDCLRSCCAHLTLLWFLHGQQKLVVSNTLTYAAAGPDQLYTQQPLHTQQL
jgi:hypothetical protein